MLTQIRLAESWTGDASVDGQDDDGDRKYTETIAPMFLEEEMENGESVVLIPSQARHSNQVSRSI